MTNESPPRVSVIIVNFNRVKLLAECLGSLERQSFRDFEMIVVDNGSEDGSAGWVAENFPQAQLIANGTNRGFCEANNQGFAVARGEYFALLNNDAVADTEWLGRLVETAEAHPECGMVGSKIYVHGTKSVIDKVGHLIYWDGQNRGRGAGEIDMGQYDGDLEILWPDGCAAVYRRAMIEQCGGFDEDFFAYADDAELGLRGRQFGWSARLAPGSFVHHHRGATMGKYNLARIHLIERNRVWLALLHFPLWLLLLNPFFFLLRLVASLFASIEGEGEAAHFRGLRAKMELGVALWKADWAALRGLGRMWRKRRKIRSRRKLDDSALFSLLLRYRMTLAELTRNRA